jgi:hypothetical protein
MQSALRWPRSAPEDQIEQALGRKLLPREKTPSLKLSDLPPAVLRDVETLAKQPSTLPVVCDLRLQTGASLMEICRFGSSRRLFEAGARRRPIRASIAERRLSDVEICISSDRNGSAALRSDRTLTGGRRPSTAVASDWYGVGYRKPGSGPDRLLCTRMAATNSRPPAAAIGSQPCRRRDSGCVRDGNSPTFIRRKRHTKVTHTRSEATAYDSQRLTVVSKR